MSTEYDANALEIINEAISRLQTPISSAEELLPLLTAPLDALGLLQPAFYQYNTRPFDPSPKCSLSMVKHIPKLQSALLSTVIPAWETVLREQRQVDLLYQCFCPDSFFAATQNAGEVALSAYSAILSKPLCGFSVDVLKKQCRLYPIDRVHTVIFGKESKIAKHTKLSAWEDALRSIFAIPAKVANYFQSSEVPKELNHYKFFTSLSVRVESLVVSTTESSPPEIRSSLSALVAKMVSNGLFQTSMPLTSPQPSFFAASLPKIRSRLVNSHGELQQRYGDTWRETFSTLQLGFFTKILSSLFSHCSELPVHEDSSSQSRGLIKRESKVISNLLGFLDDSDDEKWSAVSAALLMRPWNLSKARTVVCWAALSEENAIRPKSMETLIQKTLEVWSSREYIKHSLLSHHQYLTAILILSVCHFNLSNPVVQSVALSESFIGAIGDYIKHMDPAVRRCGMLAAEIVAQRTGRILDFQQWEGNDQGREWARALRGLVDGRDVDATEAGPDIILVNEESAPIDRDIKITGSKKTQIASVVSAKMANLNICDEGSDSDDSLTGYASSDAFSRPPSPTMSEMEEIEKDPTLNVGKKPVQRPVYLVDLARLITESTKPDDPQNADRIEMALDCAEELIRAKRSFGYELEENAVNLTHALIFLNNNFELEAFNEKRQATLNALVACCPRKAASTIIQEFFKNQYSMEQRFTMLSALTLGSRELAKLPVPLSQASGSRTSFASKRLPPTQHSKYVTHDDVENGTAVRGLLDGIARAAIESGKSAAESKTAPLVRSRMLQIKKTSAITELSPQHGSTYVPRETSYSEVAAEFFVGPLIGQFWQFLHDEQAREMRSAHRETVYRGTGTELILGPLVLSHFVQCLAVLMHAARRAPEYLAILAPEALELALTLGTRPMSSSEDDKALEAAVLTANLELAVIILDGCLELDGGRALCLENTNVLVGVGDWAGRVMDLVESGTRVPGEGGAQEAKLKRAAAGVVLKVDELTSRWRQSMFPRYM